MRVVVSVKPLPGGGQASQAARYIAYNDRDESREGKEPRKLFSAKDNSLSFWKAERVLTEGRAPAKDEVLHITISFREENFERLGAGESSRQDALKEVSREAITEITGELRADDMRWVAGIHRNTDHPHIHLLFHRGYLDRETGREKWLTRLPEEMLPHREGAENSAEKIHPGSFIQAFETALDRAQERARQTVQTREQADKSLAGTRTDERPEPRKEQRMAQDELLFEAARRNPSIAGREVIQEIILRGPAREPEERSEAIDLRAAFKTPGLDDSDYRTQPEQADWLGKHSSELRDLYERGAQIKDDVLIIPAEEYELPEDRNQPFITSLSYAHEQISNPQQATGFHALARAIAGETASPEMEREVFRYYYSRIRWADPSERPDELEKTLGEMRLLADEMSKLETRDSIEVAPPEISIEETRAAGFDEDREAEINAPTFNTAARKIRLDDEALRLPAGLTFEAKERLVTKALPAIDKLIEGGAKRDVIIAGINEKVYDKELSDEEREERFKSGVFLKAYVNERLKDPETRALNKSAAFRMAHAKIINARTPEELSQVAENFLRENHQRDAALSLHRADPESHPKPETAALSARERNLLFFGRAPEHHTPEMRELRHFWGLSRAERARRVKALREGNLAPAPVLKEMVEELESRRTLPAIRHYQATILNEEMRSPGTLDLRRMFERLPPHERTFLIERAEEKKRSIARSQPPTRDTAGVPSQVIPSSAARPFASIPRESNSYREYMASMGAIESRLLSDAVRQRQKDSGAIVMTRENNPLSITEARALLPQEEQVRIRERARNLAWEQLAPPEVFAQEPEPAARRLSDTVAHLQEETQQRARLAHRALAEFIRERSGFNGGKETLSADAAPKLAYADTERLNALKDYAARMREELYRGFESLDSLRREIEKPRSQDDIVRSPQAELDPDREQVLPLNGHFAGKDLQLANGAYFEAERNSTVEERAGNRESNPWMVDSDQKWHFDSVRDITEPTPAQVANNNFEHIHDHDFGYER
jgi:relaxase MobL-like protein